MNRHRPVRTWRVVRTGSVLLVMSVVFTRRKTPGFTGFCGKAPSGGPSGGPQCVALQVQRLGAVRLRDAGVADQHVSQTAVCDTPSRTPSGARRRVSYPVSDSTSCIRRVVCRVPCAAGIGGSMGAGLAQSGLAQGEGKLDGVEARDRLAESRGRFEAPLPDRLDRLRIESEHRIERAHNPHVADRTVR